MGREAEEERLRAAETLILCISLFIFSVFLGVFVPVLVPPVRPKALVICKQPGPSWFRVALMGADSMRSLLGGGRWFSSAAASFWWRFVFGRVTSHLSGRAAGCQMVVSEASKAERTCWWRGERGPPPGGGPGREGTSWLSSRAMNSAEVGANWMFWGEVGQNISREDDIQ